MRTRRRLRPPHWPRFDQAVTRPLEFGIFDWLEYQPDVALADTFEDRLRMLELADELGFYTYHLAQHEGTPLSLSGSPSVVIASAIQRTRRLRLVPTTYCLPWHNPLQRYESMRLFATEVMPAVSLGQEVVNR